MKNFRLVAKTIKDGVRLSEKREDSRDSRMMSRLLVAVWTLRVSRHHNHQSSQQENYRTCNGVVGGQYRRLYRNPHGE